MSYRAKANDFENNNKVEKMETKSDTVQKNKIKPVKVLPEDNNRKVEKRQGWWNQ